MRGPWLRWRQAAQQQPGQGGEQRQREREAQPVAEMSRQPEHGGLGDAGEVERVPAQETEDEAEPGAEKREGRRRRALAEAVEMGADAGTRDRHAGAEGEAGQDQNRSDRADMRVRRQARAGRVRHPGAEHHGVARDACGERRQDAEHPPWVAPDQEVAPLAVEAEPAALEHEAEQRPEHERQGEPRPAGLTREAPGRRGEPRGDQDGQRCPDGKSATGSGRAHASRWERQSLSRMAPGHLPPQTVPARLTTGTPTALPYSVQEPS